MTSERHKPCESCGTNRWKTKVKDREWQCRKCGRIRIKGFPKGHPAWKGKKLSGAHREKLKGAREPFTKEHKWKIKEAIKRFWKRKRAGNKIISRPYM